MGMEVERGSGKVEKGSDKQESRRTPSVLGGIVSRVNCETSLYYLTDGFGEHQRSSNAEANNWLTGHNKLEDRWMLRLKGTEDDRTD